MLAPVVVFTYNRPELLKDTLDSLEKNDLAGETELFLFSDGFKSDDDCEAVMRVHEVIERFEKNNTFKSIYVQKSKENKGLKNSIVSGVSAVMDRYGKAIVVEDDLVVAHNFLKFMNDSLDYYENDSKIWAIGGCSFGISKPLKEYKHDVYASYRTCSWGWASWADRWERVDFDMGWYEDFIEDKVLQKRVALAGEDIIDTIKAQHEGILDTWDAQWAYQQCADNQYTILPRCSLVVNNGFQGGTHFSGATKDKWNITLDDNFSYSLEHVEIDERLMKKFRKNFRKSRPNIIRIIAGILSKVKRICMDI